MWQEKVKQEKSMIPPAPHSQLPPHNNQTCSWCCLFCYFVIVPLSQFLFIIFVQADWRLNRRVSRTRLCAQIHCHPDDAVMLGKEGNDITLWGVRIRLEWMYCAEVLWYNWCAKACLRFVFFSSSSRWMITYKSLHHSLCGIIMSWKEGNVITIDGEYTSAPTPVCCASFLW